jgi:hypothetical protein
MDLDKLVSIIETELQEKEKKKNREEMKIIFFCNRKKFKDT